MSAKQDRRKRRHGKFAEEFKAWRRGTASARSAMEAQLLGVLLHKEDVVRFINEALAGLSLTHEESETIREMTAAAQARAGEKLARQCGGRDDPGEGSAYEAGVRRAKAMRLPLGIAGVRPRAWRSVGSPAGVRKIDHAQASAEREEFTAQGARRRQEEREEHERLFGSAEGEGSHGEEGESGEA